MRRRRQRLGLASTTCWILLAILSICPHVGGDEISSKGKGHKIESAFRNYRKQKKRYDHASTQRRDEQQHLLANEPRFLSTNMHGKSFSTGTADASEAINAAAHKQAASKQTASKQKARKAPKSVQTEVNSVCNSGAGKDPMPGVRQDCCCQICPEQFLVELQLLELSESEERQTYANFHRWHRSYVDQLGSASSPVTNQPQKKQTPMSFLETREGYPISLPFGMEQYLAYAAGPCCPVCPQNFVPQRPKGMLGMVEVESHTDAHYAHASADSAQQDDSSQHDADMEVFLEAMGQTSNAPKCCNVCFSQLMPPRRYEDVNNNPSRVATPGRASGFSNKEPGTGSTKKSSKSKNRPFSQCCGFCQETLDPVKWQPMNGGPPLQQFPSAGYAGGAVAPGASSKGGKGGKAAKSSKTGPVVLTPPPMRSPSNRREYKAKGKF